MNKWVEKLNLMPLEMGLERHGDTIQNRIIFYETFLNQSEELINRYEQEESYGIPTSISDYEYLELIELRKQAVLELKKYNS